MINLKILINWSFITNKQNNQSNIMGLGKEKFMFDFEFIE
jgi:hypothetical protein